MRIKVRHETTYTYAAPARGALQMIRLTPRSCENQFVRTWRVEIDADSRLEKSEDAYGNRMHMVSIEGPIERVVVTIEGEVDTTDCGGFVRGTLERQPEGLFLRDTSLTQPSPAIRAFARNARAAEGGDMLAALHRINAEIHTSLRFDTDATHAATRAADAFEGGHGVCQDFAQVFIAAARSLGVPARYVSGYYLRTDRTDQEAGHAWAEAHLKGLGWIGFDPAQGHCVTDRYIRVAIGADANEAAPLRGAQVGGAGEALQVAIDVTRGRDIVQQ
ncbi:MAG TPA: transglutaminase family protein [Hyphomicrobiaceae bacterium]|nr:transglutaminase family protein [Hyphomicrobiaceae bacterium]